MLNSDTIAKLRAYVEKGGTLISEGLPGYFRDHGRVGTAQPPPSLDSLFGAKENYIELTPDLLDNLRLDVNEDEIPGRYFLQEYQPTKGGQPVPFGTDMSQQWRTG